MKYDSGTELLSVSQVEQYYIGNYQSNVGICYRLLLPAEFQQPELMKPSLQLAHSSDGRCFSTKRQYRKLG